MSELSSDKTAIMMASLKEAQDTVRGYDTKAQIVGVGYIFAIGIVTELSSKIPNLPELNLFSIFMAWVILVLPIVLFGAVLYPTRRAAAALELEGSEAKKLFYVRSEQTMTMKPYLDKLRDCSVETELAYEIVKTSWLRDVKRKRFLRALWAAATSFLVMFLSQMARVGDILVT